MEKSHNENSNDSNQVSSKDGSSPNNPSNYKKQSDKQSNKQTIFLDVDDVIFNSSEVVLSILNKKYNLHKTDADIKDWSYNSIYRGMTRMMVEEIFESDDFWSQIKIREEFINSILKDDRIRKGYNWAFVTQGNNNNLLKKVVFFLNQPEEYKEYFDSVEFYGIGLNESKNKVDMINGIQVDDNFEKLSNTNAALKVLLKNDRETKHNNYGCATEMVNRDDLYIINTFKELENILLFNLEERIF